MKRLGPSVVVALRFWCFVLGFSCLAFAQSSSPAPPGSSPQNTNPPRVVGECPDTGTCTEQCQQNVVASCKRLGDMYRDASGGLKQDHVRAAALYEQACNAGSASGCLELGYDYNVGRGVAKDLLRAVALYQKGCDGGVAISCGNLGRMYRDGAGVAKDEARAVPLFVTACKNQDGTACTALGFAYELGQGVTKDEVRASAVYQQACDSGEPIGCFDLARLYLDGRGVSKDENRAVPLYKRACDGSYGPACDSLGGLYLNGRGVTKNDQRAAIYFQMGCDKGSPSSCRDLGWAYENGRGVAKDGSRAATLYGKACDDGDSWGCLDVGSFYELGRGVAKDAARAVEYYKKACDAQLAAGCSYLGSMYLSGTGVKPDDGRAFELFTLGCKGGDARGCSDLGFMYEGGRGVAKDQVRAVALYQQACDAGNATACSNLASDYLDGRGVPKDEARAVALYKRSCDAGEAWGCNGLGRAYEYARSVPMDEDQAAGLYRKACDAGNATACANLKRLTAENPEQAQTPPVAQAQTSSQSQPQTQSQAPPSGSTSQGSPSRGADIKQPDKGARPDLVAAISSRKDYALLFATNEYDSWKPLQNPLPDAEAIAKELKENYAYETEIVENPTQNQIFDVLRRYAQKHFGGSDQLLIFFAGHGIYDEQFKQGYVVARDSKADDVNKTTYISHEILRTLIDGIPSKHIFLVMDVCFGGTFDRRVADKGTRGGEDSGELPLPELVANKMTLETRKYLTSGGKNYVPDGRPGYHSPFAGHLLEVFRSYGGRKQYLTIEDVFAGVASVNPQPVWNSFGVDEPGSDFLFISKQAASSLASQTK